MGTAVTVTALIFVLGSGSAVVRARKGQWWRAGSVFLPVLGMVVMLLGGVERRIASLAGFGAEAMAYWRTRTPLREQAVQ
ncbi:hypothetical protein [Streptomyces griseoluteus]|uniref:hypothetical protein n=1 Tax=Streptomyces griseoluteus TaxID=29306 RepID=UPI0036FFC7AC